MSLPSAKQETHASPNKYKYPSKSMFPIISIMAAQNTRTNNKDGKDNYDLPIQVHNFCVIG